MLCLLSFSWSSLWEPRFGGINQLISQWITWIVLKSVLFNWLGPISHDVLVLTLLTTIQAIHFKKFVEESASFWIQRQWRYFCLGLAKKSLDRLCLWLLPPFSVSLSRNKVLRMVNYKEEVECKFNLDLLAAYNFLVSKWEKIISFSYLEWST